MSFRMPLLQIIALTMGLLLASVLPIPGLSLALAAVRLPLIMVLGVAVLYLGMLLRREELAHAPVPAIAAPLREAERGNA